MAGDAVITVAEVSHYYGSGQLRKQILFDVSAEIAAGEIVILTGPSGSGKTTLLTLMGALRATQEGSLKVLGHELNGAGEAALVAVRRQIGFIFQLHNLLDALSVTENVTMGLSTELGLKPKEGKSRAIEMLKSVGLEDRVNHYPDQLSGGQKQRVAIARALAARPRIILADEPTASLDKKSGRDVVDRLHDLAKREGTAVVLVTHDNRILDVADRIIHLEEGRLSTFSEAVRASTQRLLATLARSNRVGEITKQVAEMPPGQFTKFLEDLTGEANQLLEVMTLGTDEAFEVMLAQMIEVLTLKVGQLLDADRVSLLLADEQRGELYSMVAQGEGGKPLEIRIPASGGIAGHVYRGGQLLNVPDAYESPLFNRDVDQRTGYRTKSVLSVPILDRRDRPFAVMSLLNKKGAPHFDERDERMVRDLVASVGVVLRTWHQAHRSRHLARA
ncbi:MAG TPA: ATP-binding cassette domain-containing protein [Candidatus Eisenbacteria bacterium]|nr:ATP-binding cassette domain-containing protein [Candidatus Eisenbacteria bacterium]